MNDLAQANLDSLMEYISRPLDPKPNRKARGLAKEIISRAYFDGMESLAQDGACCADLLQTWGQFSKYEVLTEGNTDAVFKSLDAALRDCTEANLLALGKLIRDEAMEYIAKAHADDEEDIQEGINESRRMGED